MTFIPSAMWRVPPHGPRSRTATVSGVRYVVRPEAPGSTRYRLFVNDERTEIFGSGLNYVLALAESEIRRRQHGKA